jgi:hypothetical protein
VRLPLRRPPLARLPLAHPLTLPARTRPPPPHSSPLPPPPPQVTDQFADTVRAVSAGFFLTMLVGLLLSFVGVKIPGLFSGGACAGTGGRARQGVGE